MYLSKLELHGFKSFADRTVLHFDPGITAIVGPNGCGKSNVVDAVRWVVGEQRARILRSEKMENVIFNGTARRRALGMSEVLLTVENTRNVLPTEYTEVTLGRRLFRSGDSEYLMNDVQCRLRDITDLFMDTGMGAGAYSVIELKMIEEILSDNAQDRRRLFEEAAGITKYKLRRRQTLSKLDSTQADLTRIRDLTDEIGKRVRSLKRQAEKAQRYQEYAARLRTLELMLAQVEYDRLSERRRDLAAAIEKLQQQIEEATTEETRHEATLEELRLKLVKREQALSEKQRTLNRYVEALRAIETEQRLAQERLEGARRDQERTGREQEDAKARVALLEEECDRLSGLLEDAQPAAAQAEAALAVAEEARDVTRARVDERRQALRQCRAEAQDAIDELAACRRERDRLANRLDLLRQEHERLASQRATMDTAADELEARARYAGDAYDAARLGAEGARTALAEAARQRDALAEQLDEATQRQHHTERGRDAAAAEVQLLESLVSSYDAFPDAVQYLASRHDWHTESLQTVADVMACDERDRVALDAALGDLGSCIVVQDDDAVRRALALLREEGEGQATFVVLDRLPDAAPMPPSPFVDTARPLIDAVRVTGPQYRSLARLLLHDAYVVETLDEAQEAAATSAGGTRFFARSGEWVDGRGLLHGGSARTAASAVGSRLGRREQLDAATATLASLEDALARHGDAVAALRARLAEVPLDGRKAAVADAEHALREAEKTHTRVTYELDTLERRRTELADRDDDVAASITSIERETETLEKDAGAAETRLVEVRGRLDEAEKAFQAAEEADRAANARHNEANIVALQARNRRDNLQHDLQRTHETIQDLQRRAEEREAHLQVLIETIEEAIAAGEALVEQHAAARVEHADQEEAVVYAEQAVREVRDAITNVEADLRNVRRTRDQLVREENQHNVRRAEVETRTNDLIEHIDDAFGVSLPETPVAVDEAFDEGAARAEVQDLRHKVKSIGGVNELALDAYEEEKERYEFMLTQQEDLERAESKLIETIEEINTTAAERFFATFDAIRDNFQGIFADLFENDATADIVLEDAGDPLETAIEITAQPRGKRPSTIAQLSGGEKTLTAIALLFAIYLVKPSPFCILDEVDAPLDDANIERFMRLIRSFTENTQFIIVTHNKLTMEAADRLYGITMQEQGVSQLVGVKFEEALQFVDREAA